MTIQLVGKLSLPLNGSSPNTKVRFTRSVSEGDVIKTAPQEYTCDAEGNYNFPLAHGSCYVEILYSGSWDCIAHVTVDDTTPRTITLSKLIEDHSSTPPPSEGSEDIIQQLYEMVTKNTDNIDILDEQVIGLTSTQQSQAVKISDLEDWKTGTVTPEQATQNSRLSAIETKNIQQDEAIAALTGRPTLIGTFDGSTNQFTDNYGTVFGDIPKASDRNTGDYIVVVQGGTIGSSNAPELSGTVVQSQDELLVNGIWIHFPQNSNYLSSTIDDTAEGHITFATGASSEVPASSSNDLVRKAELDVLDSTVTNNIGRLGTVEAKVNTLETNDSTQDDSILDLTNRVFTIESEQTVQNQDIEDNQFSISIHNDRITALEFATNTTVMFLNGNVTPTSLSPNTWGLAATTQLTAPPGFDSNWVASSNSTEFTYVGSDTRAYEIQISGTLISDSTGDTDHLFVRLLEDVGVMTGTTKRYAAGKALGSVTSDVGFSSTGFGVFSNGNKVRLQVAKDFTPAFTLSDVLVAFRPL